MHFDPTARVSDLGDWVQDTTFRSGRPEVFCKKGVLRNFVKLTGKHLCQSLFCNKVAGLWWLLLNFVTIFLQ